MRSTGLAIVYVKRSKFSLLVFRSTCATSNYKFTFAISCPDEFLLHCCECKLLLVLVFAVNLANFDIMTTFVCTMLFSLQVIRMSSCTY